MLSKLMPSGMRSLTRTQALLRPAHRAFAVEMSMGGQRVEVTQGDDGTIDARPLYLDNQATTAVDPR